METPLLVAYRKGKMENIEETHKTVAVRISFEDYTLLCAAVDELRKEHGPKYRMSDMLRTVIKCWLGTND